MNKYPIVVITDEGKSWLDKGQRWMYRNNLAKEVTNIQTGDVVQIQTTKGEYLATGFYHETSHIVVRILSQNENEVIDEAFFAEKIKDALDYRFVVEKDNLDNCRLVFGDADLLPGLTVDKYNDVLVTQITSYAIEQRKDLIYQLLMETLKENHQTVNYIYERNDVKARTKEGLELYKGFYKNEGKTDLVISENDLLLNVDIQNGQKTGYFLDQKTNRLLIRQMAKGLRVLDCFTHTGGFALNAAKGEAKSVTAVDVSNVALTEAKKNADLNHFTNVDFVQADVFEYLDEIQNGQFDLIILDPPAFTKSKSTVKQAYYGYKRINLQAMQKLNHGGFLATCSCSRYMETSLFEQMLKEASKEANVLLKQVSVTQQNHDHPILWSMEETSYLKFFIFQIVKEK